MIAELGERAQWVQNLTRDPRVSVRVEADHFPARARVVSPATEPELAATIRSLSEEKYGWGDGLIVALERA